MKTIFEEIVNTDTIIDNKIVFFLLTIIINFSVYFLKNKIINSVVFHDARNKYIFHAATLTFFCHIINIFLYQDFLYYSVIVFQPYIFKLYYWVRVINALIFALFTIRNMSFLIFSPLVRLSENKTVVFLLTIIIIFCLLPE